MESGPTLYEQSLKPVDFNLIRREVYEYCGIKIAPVKKQMVEGRLRRRLKAMGMQSYDDYCSFVFRGDARHEEFIHLVDAITTNKTEFFREPFHFSFLLEKLLPNHLKRTAPGSKPIFRIWSAACSTGQEPYSMAMVLAEYDRLQKFFPFQVIATDISTKVLEVARKGVYPFEESASIPVELRNLYLLRNKRHGGNLIRIAPEIRRKVRFGRMNLKDPDYRIDGKVDVIFCRNVIIYFDLKTQEEILGRLVSCLHEGGYLFLGHSESIHGMRLPVKSVAPTVYEKIR